jgi:hypothetical protein
MKEFCFLGKDLSFTRSDYHIFCFSIVFILNNVIKGNVCPVTGHEGPEGEYTYSSTVSLTSAVDGGGWLTPRPGRFTLGKEKRYALYGRLGGPQGRSGREIIE